MSPAGLRELSSLRELRVLRFWPCSYAPLVLMDLTPAPGSGSCAASWRSSLAAFFDAVRIISNDDR